MNYLFDMDGVLVDSREAWFEAFRDIGGISREEFEESYWGRDLQENISELDTTRSELCDSVLTRHLGRIEPVPGAGEVLRDLEGRKALVTNTTSGCTSKILRSHGLEGLFDAVVTSDEVERGKPDPSLLQRAMLLIDAVPEETVVIGDSEEDMEAGEAAGCVTVGIGVDGAYRIESLRQLPALVKRIESLSG